VYVYGDFFDTTPQMVWPTSGGGTITVTKAADDDAFAAKLIGP
jgi:hypothetical protein